MFRLLTFCVSIVGFAAVVWFGVTVELGQRTLFGHLRAIGGSDEAQQLWAGTREKVTDFVGIEAAKRAEAAKAALKKAAVAEAEQGPAVDRAAAEPGRAAAKSPAARNAKPPTQAVPSARRSEAPAQKPK